MITKTRDEVTCESGDTVTRNLSRVFLYKKIYFMIILFYENRS